MSTINVGGDINGENIQVGDENQMLVTRRAVSELSGTVQKNAEAVREIKEALAALQEEMATGRPRQARLRELLTTLSGGVGALTVMVESIEKVRQAVGQ